MRAIEFFAAVAVLCGCSASKNETLLSPIFDVCLSGSDVTYELNKSKPVDWDDGRLTFNGHNVDVYVGLHPDFSRKLRDAEITTAERFSLVGEEKGRGPTRVLYARLRDDNHPLYVMFQGASAEQMEELLRQGGRLKTCRIKN